MQPDPSTMIQPHLDSNETLLWSGRPRQGFVLRPIDAFLIPFSLLWAGFVVFWESSVFTIGAPIFFTLWGIPFILAGMYFVFGRFLVDSWQRSKTYYGVTNQRAVIVSGLTSTTVKSVNFRTLSDMSLTKRSDGSGNIAFGPSYPFGWWTSGMAWSGMNRQAPPQFEMIPDVQTVYDIIRRAQQET